MFPGVPSNAAPAPTPNTVEPRSRRRLWFALVVGLLIGATALVYCNAMSGPFLLDDQQSIVENASLRDLGDLHAVLSPPATAGVGGRPIANLTFAFNFAVSALSPRSYHIVNVAIHLLAGLVLFGLVRRTLPPLRARFAVDGTLVAAATAAVWLLHPVQTTTVNYVSQRTELLMAFFYLATLYCFCRGAQSTRPRLWFFAMLLACALGAGSKEIIVTAPLVVLLYDRTFIAGTFASAWRARWRWYLGLTSTWLVIAVLARGVTERGAGLGIPNVSVFGYALTSCRSLLRYLALAVWPQPLVFDYGTGLAPLSWDLLVDVGLVAALLIAVVVAWRRSPAVGFGFAWFLIILAPTTSVVPVAFQPLAENRVYLPLAGFVALGVATVANRCGRAGLVALAVAALGLGAASHARNRAFASADSLWWDTLVKRPDNARANVSFGQTLQSRGQFEAALAHFEQAAQVSRDPHEKFLALNGRGQARLDLGRFAEAAADFESAVALQPDSFEAQNNLGTALLRLGRVPEALAHYDRAAALRPHDADVQLNRGIALFQSGRAEQAVAAYEAALRERPSFSDAHRNLGATLAQLGRIDDALAHLRTALQLSPNDARTRFFLGTVLLANGQPAEAYAHLSAAARALPAWAEPHRKLAAAAEALGRVSEAIASYHELVRLNPGDFEARLELVRLLFRQGQPAGAREQLEAARRLRPGDPRVDALLRE